VLRALLFLLVFVAFLMATELKPSPEPGMTVVVPFRSASVVPDRPRSDLIVKRSPVALPGPSSGR
jgi:hypothetical protein